MKIETTSLALVGWYCDSQGSQTISTPVPNLQQDPALPQQEAGSILNNSTAVMLNSVAPSSSTGCQILVFSAVGPKIFCSCEKSRFGPKSVLSSNNMKRAT